MLKNKEHTETDCSLLERTSDYHLNIQYTITLHSTCGISFPLTFIQQAVLFTFIMPLSKMSFYLIFHAFLS